MASKRSLVTEEKLVAPLEYYYEAHPTKEDLMSESPSHSDSIYYSRKVLEWNFRENDWAVFHDIGVYQTPDVMEYPLAPDISIFKIALTESERKTMRSWRMLEPNHPAPLVVFEFSSYDNWKEDIEADKKPQKYQQMGVQEYFAFDPCTPSAWRVARKKINTRLMGWRYNNGIEEIEPDQRGWFESQILGIWLQQDNDALRFYDQNGNLLLTEGEAERAARLTEQAARLTEREARLAEREARLKEQAARLEAEQKALQKQTELETLLAKLRQQGIDPDKL